MEMEALGQGLGAPLYGWHSWDLNSFFFSAQSCFLTSFPNPCFGVSSLTVQSHHCQCPPHPQDSYPSSIPFAFSSRSSKLLASLGLPAEATAARPESLPLHRTSIVGPHSQIISPSTA
ncbi:UNVERIFIED_CONTAM: hypothetical protein K2H54_011411 [Gekko kuhli]